MSHDVGFFIAKNHGIDQRLVEQVFESMRAFFALPESGRLRLFRPELPREHRARDA